MRKSVFIDNVCDAVAAHDYKQLLHLVEGSVEDINQESGRWRASPLNLAVAANDPLVAAYLIYKGANADYSKNGLTARQISQLTPDPEMLDVIAQRVKFTPRPEGAPVSPR